ncbi:hypothetical protein QJS10_CPB21g00347 [Acorus calamus]|uniref:Leucine-rich repeat-containing N-terminal plant-type domain-containing protein n=1 Tax=Acorus calamus TaxID=4465 RepID=A0AAV9C846_ACOCL|nr:hypothetical protein QJS10_CPB21g00347 [Acorus calamus]
MEVVGILLPMNDILKVLVLVGFSWSYFLHGCQGCHYEEKLALLEIKTSINYPNGSSLSNWVGEDCCGWDGIVCDDRSSRVVSIVLDQKRESGDWYPNVTMFAQFEELIELNLNGNQIKGWVMPEGFISLRNVKNLSLSDNRLNDEAIAPWINNLTSLLFLYLSDNELRDLSYMEGFHGIQNLQVLHLNSNGLTDDSLNPWIFNLTSVTELSLSHNQLRTAPWIYNLTSLASAHFSSNQLAGPSILEGNALQGSIPSSLGKMTSLQVLDLSYNRLSGEIPQALTSNTPLVLLILSDNILEGDMLPKFSNMPHLIALDLHNNSFTGVLSRSLLDSPSLKFLDVRQNFIEGVIPSWLGDLPNLASLHLAGNSFKGSVPTQLCQLQNLHILDLSNNNLSGTIPRCLHNITSWKEMSLVTFMIPKEVNTTFYRVMISFAFTTKGMQYNYVGTPFSLMTGLDLSMNQISGTIPYEMGDLVELVSLNLSNNLLTGPFPDSFQNLKNLESLDLSHNNLNGNIPLRLSQLPYISSFSVAYNNLSGCIPWERQFTTFEADSFTGNPYLRGQLLGRNCLDDALPDANDDEQGDDELKQSIECELAYYIIVAVSFLVGFLGVIASLVFMENWRTKCFHFVDKCEMLSNVYK